jgi:DNA processing protein
VVVVEAPQKSGALITSRHALECGRDVWAVPGPLLAAECRGSNKLLADGASVLWDIQEFVDAYSSGVVEGATDHPSLDAAPVPAELPPAERAVLSGVGFEPTEVDEVAGRSGVEMHELLPALALLELKGYLGRDFSGSYVRRVAP